MLVMSLSPLLGAPSPAESPPDFSKDLPTFFQECSFYLEKPYFLVRQRTSRLFASPNRCKQAGVSNHMRITCCNRCRAQLHAAYILLCAAVCPH